jgi:hypothetical protein
VGSDLRDPGDGRLGRSDLSTFILITQNLALADELDVQISLLAEAEITNWWSSSRRWPNG